MCNTRSLLLCVLASWLLSAPLSGVAADRDDARRREASRLDQQIRVNQQQLDLLKRKEANLKRQVENLEKNLPSSRERLKTLEQALADAKTAVTEFQKETDESEKALRKAAEKLAAVTKKVEESQPSLSPMARALAEYQAAKEAYTTAVDQIENSAEYKQAYEKAKTSAERLKALPEVRKQFIDKNPAVVEVQADLAGKKSQYEAVRSGVLGKTPEWSAASKAYAEAKSRDTQTDQKSRAAVAKQATLNNQVATLQRQVKQMETDLARGSSELKAIPGQKTSLQNEIDRDRAARNRIR